MISFYFTTLTTGGIWNAVSFYSWMTQLLISSSFFCLLFCDISCGPLWCVFPWNSPYLSYRGTKRQTKTFNSFSVKLYLLSDVCVFFLDHFNIYLFFLCVDLKGRAIAQGKCRFCATSSAFALYHIVTVLKWMKKKTPVSFPFRISFWECVFCYCGNFLRFDGIDSINSIFFSAWFSRKRILFPVCTMRSTRYYEWVCVYSLWSRKLNRN